MFAVEDEQQTFFGDYVAVATAAGFLFGSVRYCDYGLLVYLFGRLAKFAHRCVVSFYGGGGVLDSGAGDYSGFLEVPKNAQAVTLDIGVSSFGYDTIRIEQGLFAS